MATFPSIAPAYGAQKTSQPRVRSAQFGDGYSQRIRYGLNTNPKTWDLTWQNISEANADTIETFLDARGGAESFDWTPPGGENSAKWICQQWSKTVTYANRATITATFVQVFEP